MGVFASSCSALVLGDSWQWGQPVDEACSCLSGPAVILLTTNNDPLRAELLLCWRGTFADTAFVGPPSVFLSFSHTLFEPWLTFSLWGGENNQRWLRVETTGDFLTTQRLLTYWKLPVGPDLLTGAVSAEERLFILLWTDYAFYLNVNILQ